MKNFSIAPFLGINNRLPDYKLHLSLPQINGYYLRVADNVEVDNSRNLRRAAGLTRIEAMADAHSLFDTGAGYYLMARGGTLYKVTLPAYTETSVAALTSTDPVSYVQVNNETYFSNGTDSGRYDGVTSYPMAIPTPSAPGVVAISGALEAGWYQVAVAFENSATGEEGGVSLTTSIELTAVGGLRIVLPSTTLADKVNIYVSAANGSVPVYQGQVAVGGATSDVLSFADGREAVQRFEAPLPAGSLFYHNGVLGSFKDGMVYYGLPYRPGYYDPSEGYIPFPAEVTNVVPAQGGAYITADKTYWVPGSFGGEGNIVDVLPYGASAGTAFANPDDNTVGWFGAQGFVVGTVGGEVSAKMAENIDLVAPASSYATVISTRGVNRVVSAGWCANLENGAVTTLSEWDGVTSAAGIYGTKSDGLYLLDDPAAKVDAAVGFGKQNFETDVLKHVVNTYLGMASSAPLQVRFVCPDGVDYSYDTRTYSEDLKVQRADMGRGLRANWFDITVYNLDGSDFTLASTSFAVTPTQRRI